MIFSTEPLENHKNGYYQDKEGNKLEENNYFLYVVNLGYYDCPMLC